MNQVNDNQKELIIKLTKKLHDAVYKFLYEDVKEKEDVNDIMNSILGAHISSLHNSLEIVGKNNNIDIEKINDFIQNLNKFIKIYLKIDVIEKINVH